MKAPPRIAVTWLDAHQLREEGELTQQEAIDRAHAPLRTTTLGYLLQSDAEGITMAQEIQDQGGDDPPTFRRVCFIPRGMVIRESKPRAARAAKSSKVRKGARSEKVGKSEGEAPHHDRAVTVPLEVIHDPPHE